MLSFIGFHTTSQTSRPFSAPSRADVHFQKLPRVDGIDTAVPFTISGHVLNTKEIAARVHVKPQWPVRIKPLAANHFEIIPQKFWPANTRIHVGFSDAPTPNLGGHTQFMTDDDKMIKVNLTTQTLTAWEGGHRLRVMPTSTGVRPDWTTPRGTFWVYRRVADDHMKGGIVGKATWNVKHVPWSQYIYQGVAIHGAWWNHRFGIPKSHGCIQLSTESQIVKGHHQESNAHWLWNFSDIGTPVVIYGKTPQVRVKPLAYPHSPNDGRTSSKSGAS